MDRPTPGPRRAATSRPFQPRGLADSLVGLSLVALALIVAIPLLVVGIVRLGSDEPPRHTIGAGPRPATTSPTTPGPAVELSKLVAWSAAALSRSAVVVTDADTAQALRREGLHAVGYSQAPARTSEVDYVVDIPSAAQRQRTALGTRSRLLARSLPLASFRDAPTGGAATAAATVRQVIRGSLADARAAWRDNARLRVAGGRELIENRALRPDSDARNALSRGEVDLRIETVLGDFAASDTVTVSGPERNTAEERAGMPIRSIAIATGRATSTAAALRALPIDYRPGRVETISATTVRAVWPPTLPTASAVGNSRRQELLGTTNRTVR